MLDEQGKVIEEGLYVFLLNARTHEVGKVAHFLYRICL